MRRRLLAAMTAFGLAAAVPALGQSEPPPCSGAVPPPVIAVHEPGSPVPYATHTLKLRVSGNTDVQIRSVSAADTHVDLEPETGPELVTDRSGPFSVGAVYTAFEQDGSECTTSASTTVSLTAPARSRVTRLKRPRYSVPQRKLYKPNPEFSFSVKPDKAAPDRSPFTVRARVSRRFRLPGKSAKARSRIYPQREFEIPDSRQGLTFCRQMLLCPRRTQRGWAKELEIDVQPYERPATRGIRVTVTSPSGFPADRALKFFQTPWGIDLQVLQAGRRLARFKAVGRCSGGGQSSKCRFKQVGLAR